MPELHSDLGEAKKVNRAIYRENGGNYRGKEGALAPSRGKGAWEELLLDDKKVLLKHRALLSTKLFDDMGRKSESTI